MSVRRSLAWMLGSQGGMLVLQFGGSVVLARLLTPYEMGVYALAAAITGIISLVQAFGLALFIIREEDATREMLASAFTVNAILSVALSVAIAALSEFGGAFVSEPGVQAVMLVVAVNPLIGIFEFRPLALMERHGEFRAIALMNTVRLIVSTAVTLWLAFAGHSYMSIAWGGVAGAATGAAGAMLAGRRHVSLEVGFAAWRKILRFGVQQLAIQGVNAIAGRLSDVMLGRLLGLEALGLWARASNLNYLISYNLQMVVGRVMMVDMAEQNRTGSSLRSSYLGAVEILTAVLWPSFAGLALLAGPFIRIVYGPAWSGAAPPLVGIAAAAFLGASLTMSWEVFIVRNETGRQARLELVRTTVGTLFFLVGCLFSLVAASVARIVEAVLAQFLYRPAVQRMAETTWPDYARIYRGSLLATAAACGPALVLMLAYKWSPEVPVVLLCAAVFAGIVLWLLTLWKLGHPIAAEIGRFAGRSRQMAGSDAT